MPPLEILIVCSGNICRSPYAAGYLEQRLALLGEDAARLHSAGTLGIVGSPPSPETLDLAREAGFDLGSHRSKGVSFERVDEADLILVMEKGHRLALAAMFPEDLDKVHLLSEFHPSVKGTARPPDIFDPIGLSPEDYRRCFALIRDSVDGFLASRVAHRG